MQLHRSVAAMAAHWGIAVERDEAGRYRLPGCPAVAGSRAFDGLMLLKRHLEGGAEKKWKVWTDDRHPVTVQAETVVSAAIQQVEQWERYAEEQPVGTGKTVMSMCNAPYPAVECIELLSKG